MSTDSLDSLPYVPLQVYNGTIETEAVPHPWRWDALGGRLTDIGC